ARDDRRLEVRKAPRELAQDSHLVGGTRAAAAHHQRQILGGGFAHAPEDIEWAGGGAMKHLPVLLIVIIAALAGALAATWLVHAQQHTAERSAEPVVPTQD